jgi:glycosyltransferase involved in cell wall biosynthesis
VRKCLLLSPFPLARPKHGGQMRAASLRDAAFLAGWQVKSLGIYPAALFPASDWGPSDIVLEGEDLGRKLASDMVFGDLHVARAAARDRAVVEKLRLLIRSFDPHVIQVEHPWTWLVLRRALPPSHKMRIVYSSHNIEWMARKPLFRLGMKTITSDDMLDETRVLEEDFTRRADLVFSISDIEAKKMERLSGRPVSYLPAVSTVRIPEGKETMLFASEANKAGCRYAAFLGSAYWPNVEGFFDIFSDGLGFLSHGEQIWMAGELGDAITRDDRFRTFYSVNRSRSRTLGYLGEREKADFLAAAACVIVPVTFGAGAKLKTADAIASGRPVILTPHALEGYGPVVQSALGNGVYVAETPGDFRRLMRTAFRNGLPGCSAEVRAKVGLNELSKAWAEEINELFEPTPLPVRPALAS